MPFVWAVQSCRRRVLLSIADPYSYEQCAHALLAVFRDHEFEPAFSLLIDSRDARGPDTPFIHCLAHFLAEHASLLRHGRSAVIANPADEVATARWRKLEALCGHRVALRVFHDSEQAGSWVAE